jgi:hypothetical protein
MAVFDNGHALLVGVGADLPNTIDDAQGLAAILADGKRCAYPPPQVITLTSGDATREHVLSALDTLATQSKADSTVLVFFSGHGYQVMSSLGDYDLNALFKTAISGKEFADKLKAIPAQKLLLLLDCCHAGGIGEEKSPGLAFRKSPLPPEATTLFAKGAGRVLIASSRADESSFAGHPYSAFTLALIEALSGIGAAKMDGYVRWTDLALHARQMVPGRTEDRQHPIIDLEQADNFVLAYYAGGESQPKGLPFAQEPKIEAEPGAFRGVTNIHVESGFYQPKWTVHGSAYQAERDIVQRSQVFVNGPGGPVADYLGRAVDAGGSGYTGGDAALGFGVQAGDHRAHTIEQVFQPLQAAVQAAPLPTPHKQQARQKVEELKHEAKKEKPDDNSMATLTQDLLELVPSAAETIGIIFGTPSLGEVGPVTKFVLGRLRK